MVSLELVKAQLYVIHDHDDVLIQHYIDSAKEFVERHCDRKIVDSPTDKPEEMQVDPLIKQAIMQLVGEFYAKREAQPLGSGGVPYETVVDRILWNYKRF